MSDQCYVLEDQLFASETWSPNTSGTVRETGTFAEGWSVTRSVALADTGTLAEAYDGRSTYTLRDTGTFGEAWTLVGSPDEMLADAGTVADGWTSLRAAALADTGGFDEAWTPLILRTFGDDGTFTEVWSGFASPVETLADAAAFAEQWNPVLGEALADTGTLDDGWTSRRSHALADAGEFTDTWAPARNAIVVLRDTGTFADSWTTARTATATLADAGWFEDSWAPPGDGIGTWTANTDTWAMSYFTAFPVNSLAVLGGVLHGACADGIHRLDAAKDAGTAIRGFVTTGKDDFGDESTKRLRAFYAGATTDGQLDLTVRYAPRGTPASVSYKFEERGGEDFAPQRAKVGRGMQSRYWQFTVGNVAGADFTIDALSVIAESGSRRV